MDELWGNDFIRRLDELAQACSTEYRSAEPFPHTVIDDFFPPSVVETILDHFPKPDEAPWKKYDTDQELKLEFSKVDRLPAPLRTALYFCNTAPMLQFLENLTGIAELIPDAYFTGGGLHQIERGGKLEVHADFNKLKGWNLERRLNLLLYLNRDWKDEYGGHLELWNRQMTKSVKKVLPIVNRCVIFSTEADAYHGHPHPLRCPEGRTRKSMALYYYTNGRTDKQAVEPHSTLFQERPYPFRRVKKVLKAILPPVVTDTVRRIRG